MPDTIPAADNMVELTVTVDNHTHQGKKCAKGDVIRVAEQTAEMLQTAWAKQEKQQKAVN